MNTTPNQPAGTAAGRQAQQTAQAAGAPAPTNPAGTSGSPTTPVADPKAQQVKQPVSAQDQGPSGNQARPGGTTGGNQGGGEKATATPGAAPVVSTDGAKQAVAHAPNERDVSQGSLAKGGTGTHPVTGGQTQEYRIRGHELLQIASQRLGINTATGVTEFQWDAASSDLVVKHSPAPNAGVQGGGNPQNPAI